MKEKKIPREKRKRHLKQITKNKTKSKHYMKARIIRAKKPVGNEFRRKRSEEIFKINSHTSSRSTCNN